MARRRKSGHNVHGILLLDKRKGVSSNRALQEVRRLFNANKAGHSGSLDPLATGLLPVCFGEATKVSAFMLDDDKRYQVVIQLGIITDTGDAEGAVLETNAVPELPVEDLESCLNDFIGEIHQIPPMYSALKHQGRRLYELAREGKTVERKARHIRIYTLECLDYSHDLITLDVRCSKGTYIRTLAEDIGKTLGCGATVKELRRLEAGRYTIAEAFTLDQLQKFLSNEALMGCLHSVDEPLMSWPKIDLHGSQASFIRQGGQILLSGQSILGTVRMYSESDFIGIGEILLDGKLIPKRLFNFNGVGKELCANTAH